MCTGRVCRPPSRELTKISFTQFTGGVIVFKALLDDFKDSLTFVLDTGSGGISLIRPPWPVWACTHQSRNV
ncbi:hypothetical protein LWM68_43050 [Niabella sp. W65]|nr:hypothetical protein [Niabella sp. W65]MCH7368921.1 hypothetical protein [Niabella sp. W65]